LGAEGVSTLVSRVILLVSRFIWSVCLAGATLVTLHLRVLVILEVGVGLHFLLLQPCFESFAGMTCAHMEHDDMMDINVHELTCEWSSLLLANAPTQISWGDLGRHEV
jgi:hypothetical protein